MKLCINFANSTFNLYVLSVKLAQNTKQCRMLVLENFITVIHFLSGRKGILRYFKKCLLISIYFNVKLIVLPKILHL